MSWSTLTGFESPFGLLDPSIDGCNVTAHPGWSFAEKDCMAECRQESTCTPGDGTCNARWVEDGVLCCVEEDDPYQNPPETLLIRGLWVNGLLLVIVQVIRFPVQFWIFEARGWDLPDQLLFPFMEVQIMRLGYCGLAYAAASTLSLSCNYVFVGLALVTFLGIPVVFVAITALVVNHNPTGLIFDIAPWAFAACYETRGKHLAQMPWGHTKQVIYKMGIWPPSTWFFGWGQWVEPERLFRSEAKTKSGEPCFIRKAGDKLLCQPFEGKQASKDDFVLYRSHGGYKIRGPGGWMSLCCQDPADGQFEVFVSDSSDDEVAIFAEAPALSGNERAFSLITTIGGHIYYLCRKGERMFLLDRKVFAKYKLPTAENRRKITQMQRMSSWANVHKGYFDEEEHKAAGDSDKHSLMGRISFVFDDGFSDMSCCGIEMTDDTTGQTHFLSTRYVAIWATVRPMMNAALLGMALAGGLETKLLVVIYVR
jgi:hypothetical protein